jgi:hypothetical protein
MIADFRRWRAMPELVWWSCGADSGVLSAARLRSASPPIKVKQGKSSHNESLFESP